MLLRGTEFQGVKLKETENCFQKQVKITGKLHSNVSRTRLSANSEVNYLGDFLLMTAEECLLEHQVFLE